MVIHRDAVLRLRFPDSVDIWDHEGNTADLYRRASADLSDPPGPHGLARRLGYVIRNDARLLLGGAERCVIRGVRTIFVHRGLSPLVEGVRIYHEIAEDYLDAAGLGDPDIERAADELAYHLRMPRPAFRELVSVVGCDLAALAEPWPASQTGAALRLLEVHDTPGIVVTPREIRARGPEWVWPSELELRRMLKRGSLPDGVNLISITDRANSVLLMAS